MPPRLIVKTVEMLNILSNLKFMAVLVKKGKACIKFDVDVGRVAHQASPIRIRPLGRLHDPYPLPAGNPIDP